MLYENIPFRCYHHTNFEASSLMRVLLSPHKFAKPTYWCSKIHYGLLDRVQPWIWKRCFPSKRWQPNTRLHNLTTQKTKIDIFTDAKISHLKLFAKGFWQWLTHCVIIMLDTVCGLKYIWYDVSRVRSVLIFTCLVLIILTFVTTF
jgi:hypothetical protein